jgi:hypothetical protein
MAVEMVDGDQLPVILFSETDGSGSGKDPTQ